MNSPIDGFEDRRMNLVPLRDAPGGRRFHLMIGLCMLLEDPLLRYSVSLRKVHCISVLFVTQSAL